ncbi:unnamed protein product [Prunus armeniaca]|uniref:PROP1-like PPR domain-containing protein n=1 Tax=Prunus armeniaca TaxID=36596 RepID=A0A6J5TVM2_PRUAR|nr:unnamed protein product [Prunus armeniaca]
MSIQKSLKLEALLRVSVGVGKGHRVYYMLHKLRTSARMVSPSTANLIMNWFHSKEAERVGQIKWDPRLIREAIENGGGGWHGQGWLGKGNGLCCVQLLELMACANAVGKNWPQLTLIL